MFENLLPVFDGHQPVFVGDTPAARAALEARGVEAASIDDVVAAPPYGIALVSTDIATLRRRTKALREELPGTRALVLPLASFDPASLEYSLDVAAASDFAAAAARNKAWKEVFLRTPSPLVFVHPDHPGSELRCTLLGDVKITAQTVPALYEGQWASFAAWFEVEMEVFDKRARYFSLDGVLPVRGLVTARNPKASPEVAKQHADVIALLHEVSGQPGELVAVGNRIESLVFGDRDVTKEVVAASGDAYDRNFLEFSLGTNKPAIELDWSQNSPMNEGVDGVHVAVGDGVLGAHVDIVAPGVKLLL